MAGIFSLLDSVDASGTSSVTFNIPQYYQDVCVRGMVATTGGIIQDDMDIRLNGDSGSGSYGYYRLLQGTTTITASSGFSASSMSAFVPGSGLASAGYKASFDLRIRHYLDSPTTVVTVYWECIWTGGATTTNQATYSPGVGAYDVEPITSITLFQGDDFASGSYFRLYGLEDSRR